MLWLWPTRASGIWSSTSTGSGAFRPCGASLTDVDVLRYAATDAFTTLDGSQIREWAGRLSLPAQNQSLAEATVPVGGATTEHYHRTTEELYLVSAGTGRLVVDGEERAIGEGDCALIAPGVRHKLFNVGDVPLRVICACAPAYSDEDTCLTE
ncbi:MAG: cupin protein [Solirubrobacterales bacterium]|jgi:mannose-6-phosphate isomerase-like protein (cupin superfamily)|nr:cupin protein [Solirubrobacterales bacterium]